MLYNTDILTLSHYVKELCKLIARCELKHPYTETFTFVLDKDLIKKNTNKQAQIAIKQFIPSTHIQKDKLF